MKARKKAYGLVRDSEGRPKVDNPATLPPQIVAMLTEDERRELEVGEFNGRSDNRG